jgi:hypothetical protein
VVKSRGATPAAHPEQKEEEEEEEVQSWIELPETRKRT